MNTTIAKGQWHIIKGRLKQQFASLTDDDLHYEEGHEEELYGRLQKALGQSIDDVRKMVARLSDEA